MLSILKTYENAKRSAEHVVLIRCGDFYETFGEDAKYAAKVIGLTITTRTEKATGNSMPMCGFPYHSLFRCVELLKASGMAVTVIGLDGKPDSYWQRISA